MNHSSTAIIRQAARRPERHLDGRDYDTAESAASSQLRDRHTGARGDLAAQLLALLLQGITRRRLPHLGSRPDPHALGRELRSLGVQADPLGDRINASLYWDGDPPAPLAAAAAAGFALTPEVVEVLATKRGSGGERSPRGE